ncbi:MAG: hypothetical protein Q8M03_11875 [Legionella sp.]|nr:hypothetical protein [Legionella sp.]
MYNFVDENNLAIKVITDQIQLDQIYNKENIIKRYCLQKNIPLKTPYLTPELAKRYLISINEEDGAFLDSNRMALDDGSYLVIMTGEYNSVDSSLGKVAIYASRDKTNDSDDCVFTSVPSNLPWVVNHSNFIQGAPVVFSGYMTFFEGRVESITNNSGHYKPKMSQILPALRHILLTTKSEVIIYDDFVEQTRYEISSDKNFKNISVLKQENSEEYQSESEYEDPRDCSPRQSTMDESPLVFDGYKSSPSSTSRFNARPMTLRDLFLNPNEISDKQFRELKEIFAQLNLVPFNIYEKERKLTHSTKKNEILKRFERALNNCHTVKDVLREQERFSTDYKQLNSHRFSIWSKTKPRSATVFDKLVAESKEQMKFG